MASRKDVIAGGATIEIRAVDYTKQVFDAVGSNLSSLGSMATKFGAALIASATAATIAITALSVTTASAAAAIDDASKRTGASAEALQELRYGVEQSGGSFDDLVAGLRNMNKELADDKSADKFAAIGLSLEMLRQMRPEDQLTAIAEAISRVADSSLQTDAAMSIFGKGGFALLPFLQEGAKGITAFRIEAEKLGLVLSGDVVEKFAIYDDTIARITASTQAIASLFAASFLPVLQPIADAITLVTSALSHWLGVNQEVGMMLSTVIGLTFVVGSAFVAFGAILAGPISLFASFATILSGFVAVFGAPVVAIAAAVTAVVAALGALVAVLLLAGFAAMDFDQALAASSGTFSEFYAWLMATYQALTTQFAPVFQGIVDSIKAADFYGAARIAFMGLQLAASEVLQGLSSLFFDSVRSITDHMASAFALLGPVVRSTFRAIIDEAEIATDAALKTQEHRLEQKIAAAAGGAAGKAEDADFAKRRDAITAEATARNEFNIQSSLQSTRDSYAAYEARLKENDRLRQEQMQAAAIQRAQETAAAFDASRNAELQGFSAGAGTSSAGASSFLGGVSWWKPLEDESKKQTAALQAIQKNTRNGLGAQIS